MTDSTTSTPGWGNKCNGAAVTVTAHPHRALKAVEDTLDCVHISGSRKPLERPKINLSECHKKAQFYNSDIDKTANTLFIIIQHEII